MTDREIVDERYAAMLGYTLTELEPYTGAAWQANCHPDDLPAALSDARRLLKGEIEYFTRETRMRHKDGHWVWTMDSGRITERDASGRPLRMTGTQIDISQNIQTKTELLDSEARFRGLVEQSPLGILLMNEEGVCINWNRAMEDLTGWPAAWALGRYGWEIQMQLIERERRSPQRLEELKRGQTTAWKNLRNTDARIDRSRDFPIYTASGEQKIVQQASFLIQTGSGSIFAAYLRDMTSQRLAAAQLSESEERFRNLIEQSPLGIVFFDQNNVCVSWNQALENMTGILAADAIGQNSWDLRFRLDPPEIKTEERYQHLVNNHTHIMEGIKSGRLETNQVSEYPYVKTSGEIRQIRQTVFLINSGDNYGIGHILQDITRQRRDETIQRVRVELVDFALYHNLPEVMRQALDEAESLFASPISFLYLLDEQGKTVQLEAFSTRTQQEFCRLPAGLVTGRPIILAGVWADAIRQKQALIHNSYADLPRKKGLPDGHVALTREMVIPILRGEMVVAVLGFGNKSGEYNTDDLETAGRFADYLGNIILRKQAETNAQRLLEVVESARDLIGSALPDGQLTYLNPSGRRSLGIPAGAPVSEYNIRQFIAEENQKNMIEKAMPTAIRDGHWSGESILLTLSGDKYNVMQNIVSHRDPSGQISHLSTLMTDITDLKQVEAELRKNNLDTNAILNSSTESSLLIEANGSVVIANPVGAQRLGKQPSELIGTILDDAWQPEVVVSRREKIDEVVRTGQPLFMEDERSGLWLSSSLYPVFDENNRVVRLAIFTRDITEARLAQQALDHYHQNLETLVQERTNQLDQARQEAEAANRAKSDFLAVMSHEIRTPMNGVLGLTQLIMQTRLSEKQRGYMNKILNSGEALLSIINDILDFSKIEAGKLEMEAINFDLDSVLNSVATLIAFRAQEKGLELVLNIDPRLPRLLVGDPNHLRQVLLNLTGNAVKFTPSGEVVVCASLLSRSAQQAELQFSVRDSGIGIQPEQIARLFQPFTQADSSTSRRFGGSGLGLVISQRLAHLMNGEISVESQPGLGSTFTFSTRLGLQAEQKQKISLPDPDLLGLRALVLDDNAEALTCTSEILRALSFQVQATSSARAAMQLLQDNSLSPQAFKLLVLDDNLLDQIDSLQLLGEIRQTPGLESLPILLVQREEQNQEQVLAAGASALLVKPVTAAALFDAILRAFGRQPSTSAAQTIAQGPTLEGLGRHRILLVEDDPTNQIVARDMLEQAGLSIDIANNGAEGVQMVFQNRYDAILMDIQMPDMDGYEATEIIRAAGGPYSPARLPIIAMTANALKGDREKILNVGFNDYVSKPVDMQHLRLTLRKWLHVDSSGAPEPAAPARLARIGMQKSFAQPVKAGADTPGDTSLLERTPALERLGGNWPLYIRILNEFQQNHAHDDAVMQTSLAENDISRAHRQAHTLKGLAAQIGATRLRDAAMALELALAKQEESLYTGLLEAVSQEISAILPEIQSLTPVN